MSPSTTLSEPLKLVLPREASAPPNQIRLYHVIALSLFAVALFLPRMSLGALRHWDEAWYAQCSREMLAESSWLTVRWNGAPWFHKPPLTFWASAASFHLFGESEFTARLFAGLCGIATVALLTWFTSRQTTAPLGLVAGLALLAIPEFSRYATRGQIDSTLTLLVTGQLICFWQGLASPRWHWLGGVLFGLSLMTKGAAAGLALVAQAAFVLVARDTRCLKQPSWSLGLVVGLLIAAPWHVQQWLEHGDAFLEAYGGRHFTQFFTSIEPAVASVPPRATYYLEFLLDKEVIWGWSIAAVALAGAVFVWRERDPLLTFAWVWTLAMPLALSTARTKWSWYLVPMYPGAALLAALFVSRTRLWQERPRLVVATAACLALVSASEAIWRPANVEYESEIRQLAPLVQGHVPPATPIHTLQAGRARTCVYPIATLFYCQRPVHAAHGIEQFQQIASDANSVFYALIHESQVEKIGPPPSTDATDAKRNDYVVEVVGQSGPIRLVRIVPGFIADQLNRGRLQ